MTKIETLEPKKLLNFKDNKIQRLTLAELESTVKEDDYNNKPIMSMYHYDYVQKTIDEVQKLGLQFNLEELWAAQNLDKSRPGVSVIESVRDQFGEGDQ